MAPARDCNNKKRPVADNVEITNKKHSGGRESGGGNTGDGFDGEDDEPVEEPDYIKPEIGVGLQNILVILLSNPTLADCHARSASNCVQSPSLANAVSAKIHWGEENEKEEGKYINPKANGSNQNIVAIWTKAGYMAHDPTSKVLDWVVNEVVVGDRKLKAGDVTYITYSGDPSEVECFLSYGHEFGVLRLEIVNENNSEFHFIAVLKKKGVWYIISGESGSKPLKVNDIGRALFSGEGRDAISTEIAKFFPECERVSWPVDKDGNLFEIALFPKIVLKGPMDVWDRFTLETLENFVPYTVLKGKSTRVPKNMKHAVKFVDLNDSSQYINLTV